MTLHEAIQQALLKAGKPLRPNEIADVLNTTHWYSKKDGSIIKSNQISARVNKRPNLFKKEGGLISLQSKTGITPLKPSLKPITKKTVTEIKDVKLQAKVLMHPKNFKEVSGVRQQLPHHAGVYCIRIKDAKALPAVFRAVLEEREHDIIYIGIASQSLYKRLGQELWAKGHGTFFRSLGAVLGFTPEQGSLKGKRYQNNYKFSSANEAKIIKWIETNLLVNWVTMGSGYNELESRLIGEYLPLLNWTHNPQKIKELQQLKNRCRFIARN